MIHLSNNIHLANNDTLWTYGIMIHLWNNDTLNNDTNNDTLIE